MYCNIGRSRLQLSEQVRRIVTIVILVVEKLKQESRAAYLSNVMNMQIWTFDVERSKTHEFDDLSRSAYKFAQRNSYVT